MRFMAEQAVTNKYRSMNVNALLAVIIVASVTQLRDRFMDAVFMAMLTIFAGLVMGTARNRFNLFNLCSILRRIRIEIFQAKWWDAIEKKCQYLVAAGLAAPDKKRKNEYTQYHNST